MNRAAIPRCPSTGKNSESLQEEIEAQGNRQPMAAGGAERLGLSPSQRFAQDPRVHWSPHRLWLLSELRTQFVIKNLPSFHSKEKIKCEVNIHYNSRRPKSQKKKESRTEKSQER